MALTTYSELQTAIASHLNRTDLTSIIPDFITLAEAQLNRRLRVRRMVSTDDFTIDAVTEPVPSDFGGPRTIQLTGTSPEAMLDFIDPVKYAELLQSTYTAPGQPKFYSVVGGNFQFLPTPDASYAATVTYWARLTALSDSNTSNWLLADHPDAYLYGSLVQAGPYLNNDPRTSTWATLFTQIMDDISREDAHAQYGGRLNMRARSFE